MMKNFLNDLHLLSTRVGPFVFHAPTYRLFQVNTELAASLGRMKEANTCTDIDSSRDLKLLVQSLLGNDNSGFSLRTNLLGDQKQFTGFYLFISQECNLACTYCYGDGGEYQKQKMLMSEETAMNFLDKFITGESPGYLINFFGGEPLLNFRLMKKVVATAKERARNRGFQVAFNITTNGTIWNESIRQFVSEEIDNVTVSLDGPKDVNDFQRRPLGSFSPYQKTLGTLADLKKFKNGHYTIRAIVTKQTATRLDEVYRHHRMLTSGKIGLTTVDTEAQHALAISDEEHEAMVNELIRINIASLRSLVDGDTPDFSEFTFELCDRLFFKKYRLRPCNAGQTVLAVAADGDLYPCHRFVGYDQFRIGNVNDNPPFSENYDKTYNSFKKNSVDNNPNCSDCWARYLCGGSCYVISHLREGDMFKPSAWYCHLKRTVYDRLLSEFAEIMADSDKRGKLVANLKKFYRHGEAQSA